MLTIVEDIDISCFWTSHQVNRCHFDEINTINLKIYSPHRSSSRMMQRVAMIQATRGLASQATASSPMIRPPVAVFGVEGRYTTALYSAAAKNKKLDVVESDLKKLHATMESDRPFREFLMNPLINNHQKKTIISETLSSKLGANELTVNLLTTMTDMRRLKVLPKVIKMYLRIMEISRGEMEVTVITAKPVTEESVKKDIEASLKGFTKNKLMIKMKVDPSIIGGLIIDFAGEHYVDMSIRSKVKMYSDLIQQGI